MSFPSKGRDAFFRNDIVVSEQLKIKTYNVVATIFFPCYGE